MLDADLVETPPRVERSPRRDDQVEPGPQGLALGPVSQVTGDTGHGTGEQGGEDTRLGRLAWSGRCRTLDGVGLI